MMAVGARRCRCHRRPLVRLLGGLVAAAASLGIAAAVVGMAAGRLVVVAGARVSRPARFRALEQGEGRHGLCPSANPAGPPTPGSKSAMDSAQSAEASRHGRNDGATGSVRFRYCAKKPRACAGAVHRACLILYLAATAPRDAGAARQIDGADRRARRALSASSPHRPRSGSRPTIPRFVPGLSQEARNDDGQDGRSQPPRVD